jgi:hypothetical protein
MLVTPRYQIYKVRPKRKEICDDVKFCHTNGTDVAADCTGELEGCTVVWTSHTDTETPFELEKRIGDKRGNVFRYTHCIKVMQTRRQ